VYYDTSKRNHESLKKLNVRNSKSQVLAPSTIEHPQTLEPVPGGEMRIETDYSPVTHTFKGVNKYKKLNVASCSSRPRSVKMSSLSSRENVFRF
jgi:hypothetical protein